MELILRKAQENEYRAIIHLLASNALPTADIYEKNISLFVGVQKDEIIATIGIETYGNVALLRSLCVKEGYKNQKWAKRCSLILSPCVSMKILKRFIC